MDATYTTNNFRLEFYVLHTMMNRTGFSLAYMHVLPKPGPNSHNSLILPDL
ncbi:8212_t:CDS:2 [Dentiscutata erythropus]|uniref:8212_t:CDS:1 n=1 Tax=Dentiscutata erythropus TaxID=1348616 RepID=A0A9N8VRG1_9GLOM|nr:8212_t:CDS:2 [Dentiscutata erythropus]